MGKFNLDKLKIESPKHSFATRLSLFSIIAVGILLSAVLLFSYIQTRKMLVHESILFLKSRVYEYGRMFSEMEEGMVGALNQSPWTVRQYRNAPDKLYDVVRNMVVSNPYAKSATIAFEPDYFPSKGEYFAPTCIADSMASFFSSHVRVVQLGSDDYNYHRADWYQIPKLTRKHRWSDPYFDNNGINEQILTLSIPIFEESPGADAIPGDTLAMRKSEDGIDPVVRNAKDRFIGVVAADVSMDMINYFITQTNESDNYVFILGRDGRYIMHPNPEYVSSETFFTTNATKGDISVFPNSLKDSTIVNCGRRLLAGQYCDSLAHVTLDGTSGFIFVRNLDELGWTVCLFVSDAQFYAPIIRLKMIFIGVFIVGLILLFIICYRTAKHVSKPLEHFARSAEDIAGGNFDTTLPKVVTEDEMRKLHDSFQFMQQSLKQYISDLQNVTTSKERIESELRIAHQIQMDMIPKIFPPYPDRKDLDVYASLTPAKEVGGDLYDFFMQDNMLNYIIGDVAGKGVPASLVMAVARTMFRIIAANQADPAKIVTQLNNALSDGNDTCTFVTVFVGVIDLDARHMVYCNGGHDAPVIITPDGHAQFMDLIPNMPAGIISDFEYKKQEMDFPVNTTILMYTDGLNEAENSQRKQYSEKRILDAIEEHEYPCTAETLIHNMLDDVHAFVGDNEQSDDLTMLAIRLSDNGKS